MNREIRVDLVSDVVCPWCIIGYKHLELAIKALSLENAVSIHWQPFELNPALSKEGENLSEHLIKKYGITQFDSDRARENITNLGSQVGFKFNFHKEMKIFNTFEAHVLIQYAAQLNRQTALKEQLFTAYFTEGEDISNREVLISQAEQIGISANNASNAIVNPILRNQVKESESRWRQRGISGVPTIIFNNEEAFSGAQSIEALKDILKRL